MPDLKSPSLPTIPALPSTLSKKSDEADSPLTSIIKHAMPSLSGNASVNLDITVEMVEVAINALGSLIDDIFTSRNMVVFNASGLPVTFRCYNTNDPVKWIPVRKVFSEDGFAILVGSGALNMDLNTLVVQVDEDKERDFFVETKSVLHLNRKRVSGNIRKYSKSNKPVIRWFIGMACCANKPHRK